METGFHLESPDAVGSGHAPSVSNCEMSSYYMQSGSLSSSYSKLDFVEDYDYDYFQRESHCKTTSSSTLGVCAVVVRRGGRVSTTLIKSSHHTVTSSQCEHLCATSLFRCRAFSFRHTTRGHDPYHSHHSHPSSSTPARDGPPPSDHTCLLYDTDLMRLPSYNIEPDQDYDLFEMGRLMGAECVLYEQFLNRRPGYYSPPPVTSTPLYPPENREFDRNWDRDRDRDRYYGGGESHHHGNSNENMQGQHNRGDQHPHGTGMNYLINNRDKDRGGDSKIHEGMPPSTLETGIGGGSYDDRRGGGSQQQHHVHHVMEYNNRSGGVVGDNTPYYDKGGKESCLRVYRQDAYLIPEVSRATFPVKNVDECRIECIRSMEVLRFPCRAMAFRHTTDGRNPLGGSSPSSGSCQLSDNEPREPDLVISRDRYDNAVTFLYDDREVGCRRQGGYNDGAMERGRYPGYVDYYNQNRNTYYPSYHQHNSNSRHNNYNDRDRYYHPPTSSSNRYYHDDNRRYSGSNSPPNYNAHYWDYHNRYDQNNRGGENKYYGQSSNNYYSEYPRGQGGTTVNGERCMRGCRVNRDAGFYYCQTDEQGAWDFCCRPDHFCGYSKGLSVPWCYVGTGPSQNIWRSCEAKGTRNNPFFVNPNVAYLHESSPPTVFSLTSTQVANLTKDNAIKLFNGNNSLVEDVGGLEEEALMGGDSNKKKVSSSQEVIVRVSNSTAEVSNKKPNGTGAKKT